MINGISSVQDDAVNLKIWDKFFLFFKFSLVILKDWFPYGFINVHILHITLIYVCQYCIAWMIRWFKSLSSLRVTFSAFKGIILRAWFIQPIYDLHSQVIPREIKFSARYLLTQLKASKSLIKSLVVRYSKIPSKIWTLVLTLLHYYYYYYYYYYYSRQNFIFTY